MPVRGVDDDVVDLSDRKLDMRPEQRTHTILFWIAGAVLVAAFVGLLTWSESHNLAVGNAADTKAGAAVSTARAERRDVPIYLVGLGTVQALNSVLVRSRVDGQLEKIAFSEGQDVKRDDVLAIIDPQPFEAQLRQAVATQARDSAQLANAQMDFARYNDSIHRGAVSAQILDTAKAQVAQLSAQVQADGAAVDAARVQLGYSTIRSPIDGRTGARLVDAGNMVRSNDAGGIVLVNQIRPIAVTFTLPGEYLPRIQSRQAASALTVLAQDPEEKSTLASGRLVLIDNQIDTTTATIKLKAEFANEETSLWPGQFVNARVLLETRKDAVTVPTRAVQIGPKGNYVFLVAADQSVDLRQVKTGATVDGYTLIESGVAAGDEVVVEGHYKLEKGSRVHVIAAVSQ